MRQTHGAAVAAGGQVTGFKKIMGAATIAATFGYFTLWQWGHATFSLIQSSGFARCLFCSLNKRG